ncbi:MAG: type III pantothenate kinase [Marinifilaceae bacterium]|nr:type III pantothenate kinase [Marinifilaceae bacterium]
MNVVIDVGNTRMKFAIFENGEILYRASGYSELIKWLSVNEASLKKSNLLVSGSGNIYSKGLNQVREKFARTVDYTRANKLKIPLCMEYETPSTLGVDRVADAVAAVKLFPGRNILIIDAGTAITIDYVSADGCFLGGNISPGVEMRYKALHDYTARLPLISGSEMPAIPYGKNTHDAIHSGVVLGVIHEVQGYIDDFLGKWPHGVVILTGGDEELLNSCKSHRIVLIPTLQIIGLDAILTNNI